MQKIVPHLWYDREAGEAGELYTSLFADSAILSRSTIGDTPSGTVELLTIQLAGQRMMLMSGGPYFKFTPAVSFLVACDSNEEVDRLYTGLHGGPVLMPLDRYPFSERYAWIQDRFGLNWQLMRMGDIPYEQKITPTLMFTGAVCGQAEEALKQYAGLFAGSRLGSMTRYGDGEAPDAAGTIKHGSVTLAGQQFAAMDSAYDHGFTFNEAISFMVYCDDQAEIDRYCNALSARPDAEQCGWLKDRYGVSWQIVPTVLDSMMASGDSAATGRVTQAFLKMKKFDIAELARAFEGA